MYKEVFIWQIKCLLLLVFHYDYMTSVLNEEKLSTEIYISKK